MLFDGGIFSNSGFDNNSYKCTGGIFSNSDFDIVMSVQLGD